MAAAITIKKICRFIQLNSESRQSPVIEE